MKQLSQLHKIAQVRERRAVTECQKQHQRRVAAERARHRAVEVVHSLQQARDDVLAGVWREPVISCESLQAAFSCADYFAGQQQVAQRKVVQAETDEAKVVSEWEQARADQALAMRSTFKLGKALDKHLVDHRRAVEQHAAQLREDDAPSPTSGSVSW